MRVGLPVFLFGKGHPLRVFVLLLFECLSRDAPTVSCQELERFANAGRSRRSRTIYAPPNALANSRSNFIANSRSNFITNSLTCTLYRHTWRLCFVPCMPHCAGPSMLTSHSDLCSARRAWRADCCRCHVARGQGQRLCQPDHRRPLPGCRRGLPARRLCRLQPGPRLRPA